jgi:hypothetical protein
MANRLRPSTVRQTSTGWVIHGCFVDVSASSAIARCTLDFDTGRQVQCIALADFAIFHLTDAGPSMARSEVSDRSRPPSAQQSLSKKVLQCSVQSITRATCSINPKTHTQMAQLIPKLSCMQSILFLHLFYQNNPDHTTRL